jgi:protein O-mannosyl-transferase
MGEHATKSETEPTEAATPFKARPHLPVWQLAVLLALVTITLYWPALRCDFVSLDDPDYVTANPHVQGGLTWEGVKWAFSNTEQGTQWAPLMWLSHELACQLFGLNPWGHHLMNVLLHATNVALVFLVFQRMTRATWRCFMLAALFGWHPLRVESVAWVAERKDVLSTFFWMLTLLAYARYVQRSEVRGQKSGSNLPIGLSFFQSPFYWLGLFFFALGLMSKAMLVTLPCVLLLLDYWPLKRVSEFRIPNSESKQLLLEKIPFFALAVAASVVTFVVQKHGGAVTTVEILPLDARIENALISYCRYLGMMFWPRNLLIFYQHPGYWRLEQMLSAGVFLFGISMLLFVERRRYPYLLMGWLWFVGTLVPVIGLVQVGIQAMADRYTYVPSLGVLILTIWGVYEMTRGWRYHKGILSVAGLAAIVFCLALTRQQIGYWQDSETLSRHTLEITENNNFARNILGDALIRKGQINEAISQYQEAIRLKPDDIIAHNKLGEALFKQGQTDEAIDQFREAVRLNPDDTDPRNNLGDGLFKKGQINEAISQFQEVIRLKPDDAKTRNKLKIALVKKEQSDEAVSQYEEAIRLKPDDANAHENLGIALLNEGQTSGAISQFQEVIRLKPDDAEAHDNLGMAFLRNGQVDEAVSQYQEAIRLKPDYVVARFNLGVAFLNNSQPDKAISQFQEVIRLEPDYPEAQNKLTEAFELKSKSKMQPSGPVKP